MNSFIGGQGAAAPAPPAATPAAVKYRQPTAGEIEAARLYKLEHDLDDGI